MAKSPAILFYTSDFLTGTYSMSDAAKGRYITLLCLQHQQGHLTKKEFFNICKRSDTDIISKFLIDENGCYYNERMDVETKKREFHSEKQRANIMKRWNENGNAFGNTVVLPLENENENIKENKIEDKENKGCGEKEKKKRFVPPTLEEVQQYCKERNNGVDAKKFFDYFTTSNWVDSKGQKVKNWKQKVITWERNTITAAPQRRGKLDFLTNEIRKDFENDSSRSETMLLPDECFVAEL